MIKVYVIINGKPVKSIIIKKKVRHGLRSKMENHIIIKEKDILAVLPFWEKAKPIDINLQIPKNFPIDHVHIEGDSPIIRRSEHKY